MAERRALSDTEAVVAQVRLQLGRVQIKELHRQTVISFVILL
jgi:hypothetical protein